MALELPKPDPIQGDCTKLSVSGAWRALLDEALDDAAYRRFSLFAEDTPIAEMRAKQVEANALRYLTLTDADTNLICGFFELSLIDADKRWLEIGYWVIKECRGRGFATDALAALTAWIGRETDATRIELKIHPQNFASQKVARKAGYKFLGEAQSPELGGSENPYELFAWQPETGSAASEIPEDDGTKPGTP